MARGTEKQGSFFSGDGLVIDPELVSNKEPEKKPEKKPEKPKSSVFTDDLEDIRKGDHAWSN